MKTFILIAFTFYFSQTFAQCEIAVDPSSCNGDNATINILSGEFYSQYQWYFKPSNSTGNFQLINGAVSPSFTFDWLTYNQGLVKLECFLNGITVYFSNTLQLDIANCVLGIAEENQNSYELSIFPNPVHDYFTLNSFNTVDTIEIFNSVGQNVFTSKSLNLLKVDTSSLKSGIYILKTISGNTSKTIRFIKS